MTIELLESRIAPAATFVSATTATYTDVDGDLVTVKFSKPIITGGGLGNLDSIIHLSTPSGAPSGGQHLDLIDLTGVAAAAKGTTITITAVPQDATLGGVKDGIKDGDGLANVDYVNATGIDLGAVSVRGDLARIVCGQPNSPAMGLASLKVVSFNLAETANEAMGISSVISGKAGPVTIAGDFHLARIFSLGLSALTIGGALDGGEIDASGSGLGTAKIGGDVRGYGTSSPGRITGDRVGSVTVGGSVINGEISAFGALGPVKVAGNLETHVSFSTDAGSIHSSTAGITSVTIGGSIISDSGSSGGSIISPQKLGPVKIGGSVRGDGDGGGRIVGRGVTSITIGGSVLAGGQSSCLLYSNSATDALGPVVIGGDFVGGLADGAGGIIGPKIVSVTIHGSLIGGGGMKAGTITGQTFGANPVSIGTVKIDGDLRGGGPSAGSILSAGDIASVTIGGKLVGGSADGAGSILADKTITKVTIAGDAGGEVPTVPMTEVGQIRANLDIGSVTIGGSLIGGIFSAAGRIHALHNIGSVTIGHDVHGYAANSGQILADNTLGSVTILGNLIGGGGQDSGEIRGKGITSVKIGGDLRGGTGFLSGNIQSDLGLASVTVGGSIRGGFANGTGAVFATGNLAKITVAGSLLGGDQTSSTTAPLVESGSIRAGQLGTVFIGGSIALGADTSNSYNPTRTATVQSDSTIGSLTVLGGLRGRGFTTGESVLITAAGLLSDTTSTKADVAIGKLDIRGDVQFAQIFAGYNVGLGAVNADAQIGSVVVGGDWVSSNLIAGVANGGADFGDANDVKISGSGVKDRADAANTISKIASVVIKGGAYGSPFETAHTFGLEAQQIVSLKIGGATVPLLAGAGNDKMLAGNQAGAARPLGSTLGTTISDQFDFHAIEVS